MNTIDKIKRLQQYSSNNKLEKEIGLSKGYLGVILSCKHPIAPTTEEKINRFYLSVIKGLVEKL